jgi:hypothetical protein
MQPVRRAGTSKQSAMRILSRQRLGLRGSKVAKRAAFRSRTLPSCGRAAFSGCQSASNFDPDRRPILTPLSHGFGWCARIVGHPDLEKIDAAPADEVGRRAGAGNGDTVPARRNIVAGAAIVDYFAGYILRHRLARASRKHGFSGISHLVNWRRGRDSNPRYGCPYAAFRVRCIQPLCHLSGARKEPEKAPIERLLSNQAGQDRQGLDAVYCVRPPKTRPQTQRRCPTPLNSTASTRNCAALR